MSAGELQGALVVEEKERRQPKAPRWAQRVRQAEAQPQVHTSVRELAPEKVR